MTTAHCPTCQCGEASGERWFEHVGKRCSNCSWRNQQNGMSVVLHVTDRGAKRYLCRACAEKAGWDGTFTPTSTDRLLKAQIAYQNGDLSLTDYLSEIDRATEEGATDKALRDADGPGPTLPDGVYVIPDSDPNGGGIATVRIGDITGIPGFTGSASGYGLSLNGQRITTIEGNTP